MVSGVRAFSTPSPVSGSIEHAECTQPEDARKIRAEIGGESDEVDFAIQVGKIQQLPDNDGWLILILIMIIYN